MSELRPRAGMAIAFGGEALELLPERAVWAPAHGALLVADLHFGKESIFRRHGIAIPDGPSDADLARLSLLCDDLGADALWILGDLLHGELSALEQERLQRWLVGLAHVQVHLVQGNHDRHGEMVLPALSIRRHDTGRLGALQLRHASAPPASNGLATDEAIVCGHVHPVATVKIARHRPVRVPVFACTEGTLTLPAFGEFTGGHALRPAAGLKRYAVMGSAVVELPAH